MRRARATGRGDTRPREHPRELGTSTGNDAAALKPQARSIRQVCLLGRGTTNYCIRHTRRSPRARGRWGRDRSCSALCLPTPRRRSSGAADGTRLYGRRRYGTKGVWETASIGANRAAVNPRLPLRSGTATGSTGAMDLVLRSSRPSAQTMGDPRRTSPSARWTRARDAARAQAAPCCHQAPANDVSRLEMGDERRRPDRADRLRGQESSASPCTSQDLRGSACENGAPSASARASTSSAEALERSPA